MNEIKMKRKRVCLIILDGFGYSEKKEHNAISLAHPENWEGYLANYPHSLIETSGRAVGLPPGIMGNSEVGHLNIGSGRVINQEFTRISDFSRDLGFETLPDIKRVMAESKGTLHFMGLLSDGGVHSDIDHLFGLIDAAVRMRTGRPISIHAITDGRDTPPKSAAKYIEQLENKIKHLPNIVISTVIGRFHAMDRDKRWERVEKAYKALTKKESREFQSASAAVSDSYVMSETDEFLEPRQIKGGMRIAQSDQLVFFNFRADRAREISEAFALPEFKAFSTPVKIEPKNWVCFTMYQKNYPFPVLFPKQYFTHLLGEEIANAGLSQLRVAETEKYAHVTYFFNGGEENPFEREDRILVPSPREVETYDLKPEMSAFAVKDNVLKGLSKDYALIVVNFANGDMVGHTGKETAAVSAVKALDECLGEIVLAAKANGVEVLITADHGNCEEMVNPKTGEPFTQHTTNPVPLVWISDESRSHKLRNGILADIAPTILQIMGLEKPKEMTGHSLMV